MRTAAILRRGGELPDRLRQAVLSQIADPRWLTSRGGDPDDLVNRAAVWRALAAAFPLEEWVDDEWRPVRVTLEELDAGVLAEEDVDALMALVQRTESPELITARSLFLRGEGPDPDADEEVPAEDVPGWEPFPSGADGAAGGGDGGAVGDAPEPGPAGDPGRGRRVPGGRGAGRPAVDRGGAPGGGGTPAEDAR
jgi:hypothetical protein